MFVDYWYVCVFIDVQYVSLTSDIFVFVDKRYYICVFLCVMFVFVDM